MGELGVFDLLSVGDYIKSLINQNKSKEDKYED